MQPALVVQPVLAHRGGDHIRPPASGPRWQDLASQRPQRLNPGACDWAGIDAIAQASGWIGEPLSRHAPPSASASARACPEWVKLSPAERGRARLNFQNARQITPEERQARWQAYQSLSPERAQQARRARRAGRPRRNGQAPREGIQNKSNIVPNPSFAASPRPVAPSMSRPLLVPPRR